MALATQNGQEPTTNQPLQPTRDERMRSIRPILPGTGNESESSALQTFQDQVLRPILKLQHELLLRLAGVGLLARHPDWAHWGRGLLEKCTGGMIPKLIGAEKANGPCLVRFRYCVRRGGFKPMPCGVFTKYPYS